MTALGDFARRVEQDCAEAVRLVGWMQSEAHSCGKHDLEPGESALQRLEQLQSDARMLAIREETRPWKSPAELRSLPLVDRIRYALSDPDAPWYGSDLVPWVADLIDGMERP